MESLCIFLVDDDVGILESFKSLLDGEGYKTFTATKRSELEALLVKKMPNLIIIDYNLGKENGGLLAESLKKNTQTSHIPIVIISGDPEIKSKALLQGADYFIDKPFKIPQLLAKIKQAITPE